MAEVLISPIDTIDDAGHWADERLILDDHIGTWARHWHHSPDTWTGYLVVVFPPTFSNGLRYTMMFPNVAETWQLDVYKDEQWVNLRSDHHPPGSQGGPIEFFPGLVTAVRVRMMADRHSFIMGGPSRLVLIQSCSGPLAPLCAIFHTVGNFFSGLADQIDDIMFVGDALAAPFVSVAGTFHDLGDTCCEVSAGLQAVLDMLENGITWDEILELIQFLIPELPAWLDDPVAFITEIVNGIVPDLPDWLTDPVAWLAAMLEENFPILYYLIVDPGGWLLYIVGEAFGLDPYQVQNWDFVLKALFERYFPELYLLWRELSLLAGIFEHEGAVGVLNELTRRFYNLAERALRYVWEGEWRE